MDRTGSRLNQSARGQRIKARPTLWHAALYTQQYSSSNHGFIVPRAQQSVGQAKARTSSNRPLTGPCMYSRGP